MRIYKVIKGIYHVKGFSPDGDSIRFEAEDPANWDFFRWKKQKNKDRRKKQLRIEAIDALETHYKGVSQPRAFAIAALERMLALLGISNIEYNLLVTKINNANDKTPGYIVSAALDAFDRPLCFAFPDISGFVDGDEIQSTEIPLADSINFTLARDGIVYPTFYTTMEEGIIEEFRQIVLSAKNDRRGIWAIDRTHGFTLWNTRTVQEDVVILPKLFRRFISFFDNRTQFEEFPDFLASNEDPVVLRDGTESSLDKLLQKEGNFYALTVPPEDIIFKPKQT